MTNETETSRLGGPDEPDDDERYVVVTNAEEQYSIWRADRQPPAGWDATGFTGTKAECLAHIDEVWIDMRPLSARAGQEGV
jgi:MbtH protein